MTNLVRGVTLLLLVVNALSKQCKDKYTKAECLMVKEDDFFLSPCQTDYGSCFMYADECEETCGCNYDPAEDRETFGLDDAYYESDQFQCVNGEDFEDSWHYNCTVYEGAGWCQVNEKGETVMGDGWCNWIGPDKQKCNIDPTMKWPKWEYAAVDGKWAKSCCCNNGLYEEYPYERDSPGFGGDCVDKLGYSGATWNDGNAYSCRSYYFGSFCYMNATTGSGWNTAKFGSIESYAYDGYSPLQACCACGGGHRLDGRTPYPTAYVTAAPTPSYTPAPTSEPTCNSAECATEAEQK